MNTVPLFEEYRNGVLECIHSGMICVVDESGVREALGDSEWYCYYRSASKSIQALPVIMHGLPEKYGLTEEETAIFSGSIMGDEEHVRVLESILKKTGLSQDSMIMKPTYPGREERKFQLIREGKAPSKLYHNCAGKHIGMMLLARALGEPVGDYWKNESGVQQEILSVLSQMTDVSQQEIRVGVDGCGVPVYAVPFSAIARSFLRIVRPELIANPALRNAVQKNTRCVHSFPNMVGGSGIICSILSADHDLFAKAGALGVYAIGVRSLGIGIVGKLMDGSHDEFGSLALEMLRQLGVKNPALEVGAAAYSDIIKNDNDVVVGERTAVFRL